MAEFVSEIGKDLFFFAENFISVFLSYFFHGLGVRNAGDKHLMFDLLADSSGQVVVDGNGSGFAVHVVCDVGNTQGASEGEVKFDVHVDWL